MIRQFARKLVPKSARPLFHQILRPVEVAWFRRKHVGVHSFLHPTAQIIGWSGVRIGSYSALSEDVWFNANRKSSDFAIVIGDHCMIGRRNFFSSGPRIHVGSYVMTGIDVRLLGASHVLPNPYIPYLKSDVTYDGEISIGTNCWLSDSVIVLGGVNVGHGSLIGAGSLVTKNVPPFSIAVGNPCRVIKRYDFISGKYVRMEEWSSASEQAIPDETFYLNRLKRDYPDIQPLRIHLGHEHSSY